MKKKYKPGYIPESKIESYLVKEIKKIGGMCIKGNPHNQRGMPDRICILPNRLVVFVELKRPGLKPRPNQRLMIRRLKALDHHAVWANSYGMIDKLILWCRRQINTTQVVGTDYICTRPECKERVKKPWIEHLQSTDSSKL